MPFFLNCVESKKNMTTSGSQAAQILPTIYWQKLNSSLIYDRIMGENKMHNQSNKLLLF